MPLNIILDDNCKKTDDKPLPYNEWSIYDRNDPRVNMNKLNESFANLVQHNNISVPIIYYNNNITHNVTKHHL